MWVRAGTARILAKSASPARQEHVGLLEVAVDDALLVGVLHGAGQRLGHQGGVTRRLRRAANLARQAAALDVLQTEKRTAVVLAHLEYLHDVGVRQPPHRLRLDQKPRPLLRART